MQVVDREEMSLMVMMILDELGCLDEYEYEFNKMPYSTGYIPNEVSGDFIWATTSDFIWANTRRGYEFWMQVHEEVTEQIKAIYSVDYVQDVFVVGRELLYG